jgi:nitrogen fixation/metabolism regulation signal transduction histidine kinase
MTLRARLLLALLAVALIPTGIFTLFTLDQLNRAIGRWYRPGVDRALEQALEITKRSITRLEALVLLQAGERASSWNAAMLAPSGRPQLAASVGASGIDFLQIYRRGPSGWSMADQVVASGVILPQELALGPELSRALESDHLIRSDRGALASVAPLPGGEALVAGIVIDPDFFEDAEMVAVGMTHYRRLGVYVDVERRVVIFLLIGVALALVALSVLLATRFAREMSSPIADLSSALAQVAGGQLETRVTPRGALELRSLGDSFNVMAERLEGARAALQAAEREAAWRDVARKLAHEFKNILTPMQLSLQLLEDQVAGLESKPRAAADKSLSVVLREVGHLGRLAEQFSQYARLPEPRFEALDVADVVRSAAALAPDTRIDIAAPADTVLVRGDRLLLSRAVHNLLLNACEAGPAGATVEVRVARANGEARIDILDCGPGLPEALRDRLFEPYVSTKKRGSGLGLSLVRDIVRQHGGTLSLENRPSGGAIASLSLPLAGSERSDSVASQE